MFIIGQEKKIIMILINNGWEEEEEGANTGSECNSTQAENRHR